MNTPLGERLAAVANKYKKVNLGTSLRARLNQARARGEIRSEVEPVYQNYFTKPKENKTKVCGRKPPQFIGTRKNPEYNEWKECTGVAVGGKRKTRKAKKSRRTTRRR